MHDFMAWLVSATVWDWMTNMTAIFAIIMLILAIIGFRRYTSLPRNTAMDFLGTGIWILAITNLARMMWWDLIPFVIGHLWSDYGLRSEVFNWVFNFSVIVGCWFMLRGYWMLVERVAPGQYGVLTSVFYPKRLRLWFEPKRDE